MNSVQKKIELNITKKVEVKNSPFRIIIYVHKNDCSILIEDVLSGKSILTSSYNIKDYLQIKCESTPWKETFNKMYIKINDGRLYSFTPLYHEDNRFALLTFKINKLTAPKIRTKIVNIPEIYTDIRKLHGTTIKMIDNTIPDILSEIEQQQFIEKSYNYLYKNIKEFETENFKLELVDNNDEFIVDENFNFIKRPIITCRLPLFKIYTILERITKESEKNGETLYNYDCVNIFMRINNKFYRFPYGNVSSDSDRPCLGSSTNWTNKEDEYIQDIVYAHLVTSEFNGDYCPQLKFDNNIQTTLDIDLIREKVNNNQFDISFIDALFYLSQCKSIEEINKNIFIFTVNVPKEILEFEKAKYITVSENETQQTEDNVTENLATT